MKNLLLAYVKALKAKDKKTYVRLTSKEKNDLVAVFDVICC